MTLQHWSDYHAWRVSPAAMQAAQVTLTISAYADLLRGASRIGSAADDYTVAREAIEDAALAMPPEAGSQWLAAVYQLDQLESTRLLATIQVVRKAT